MSNEYNTMAESINQTFQDELMKYERLAVEAAVRMAQNHGLEESAARHFVRELLDEQRHNHTRKVRWRTSY